MSKLKITILHDKDGVYKVYQEGPHFIVPEPENFKPLDSYVCYAETNPVEFLKKWPKSRYNYEIVGKGVQDSQHTTPPLSQEDIIKYAPENLPPELKSQLIQDIQGAPIMHYGTNEARLLPSETINFKQDVLKIGTQRLIMVYTKLCAKLGGLKGKSRELLEAEIRGFKNGVLMVDSTLNNLLMDIESDI